MNFLLSGHFFAETIRTIHLGGITLSDTFIEARERVNWHYHENAYFTLILQGEFIEGSKKKHYHCSAGSALFHSPQEPHYNIKLENNTKFFNVEFDNDHLSQFPFETDVFRGITSVENPDIKFLLYKILQETRICDDLMPTSIEMLLFEIFGKMLLFKRTERKGNPFWVKG
jgi:AraC family transcriptional regulator